MPPPRVYITVSRSGQTRRPCTQMSSPVLPMTVISASGRAGLQAAQEAGAADAAGEDRDAHPVILSDGSPRPTPVIAASPGFGGGVSQNGGMADEEVSGALPDTPPVRATDETAELPVVSSGSSRPVVEPSRRSRSSSSRSRSVADAVEPEPAVAEPLRRLPRRPAPPATLAVGRPRDPAGLVVAVVAGGLWYVSGLIGAGARVPQPDAGFAMTDRRRRRGPRRVLRRRAGVGRPGPDGHRLRGGRATCRPTIRG